MVMWEFTGEPLSWWIWKLISVRVEGVTFTLSRPLSETVGSGSLPLYDGLTTVQPPGPAHAQHVESERDEFGTVVTEVTVVTTRKRYRVEDA